MSAFDVSRLTGPGPVRSTARDHSGPPATAHEARARTAADKGVAVETLARASAGAMPVDSDRVAQIRAALREGSYPLVPAQISDAIIAARLMLSGDQ